MSPMPAAGLRPFLVSDTPALAALLSAAVFELMEDDYDSDQLEIWAAPVDDEDAFAKRLSGALTLIAERDGEAVGFIALTENRVIEMLYVRPDIAGQGVGTMLCDAIERLAGARGAKTLTVDSSDTALNFFRNRKYIARRRNTVPHGAVWLGTTTVEKNLAEAAAAD